MLILQHEALLLYNSKIKYFITSTRDRGLKFNLWIEVIFRCSIEQLDTKRCAIPHSLAQDKENKSMTAH